MYIFCQSDVCASKITTLASLVAVAERMVEAATHWLVKLIPNELRPLELKYT